MAFGIKREELISWKKQVQKGEIAFLTHYWMDDRFPNCYTVTKVGCNKIPKLIKWGKQYGLDVKWIHEDNVHPHFDLFGEIQKRILVQEGMWDHITKFKL